MTTEQISLSEAPVGPLRAISLTQPWASLVAIGAKRYETRSWATQYRGPLAIAATVSFPRGCQVLSQTEPFLTALSEGGYKSLQDLHDVTGHIVAVVDLVGCVQVNDLLPCVPQWPAPGEHEHAFGDYSTGRFAWVLVNLRRLERPVPAKGALGVWTVPADVERAIRGQLQ